MIPEHVKHPVEFRDGFPVDPSRYNTATEFLIRAKFANDVEIEIRHDGDNGILFEGTEGRIFVNRGRISGKPVEDLKSSPLPASALEAAYKNRPLVDHFRNFFEAARDRVEPISDVFSHHRALSTCHLAGIAARLNRPLKWDRPKRSFSTTPWPQVSSAANLAKDSRGLNASRSRVSPRLANKPEPTAPQAPSAISNNIPESTITKTQGPEPRVSERLAYVFSLAWGRQKIPTRCGCVSPKERLKCCGCVFPEPMNFVE